MGETTRKATIDQLSKLKLGKLSGWFSPKPLHDVGPSDSEFFEQFEMKVGRVEEQLRKSLEAKNTDELEALLNKYADGVTVEWFEQLLGEEINRLRENEPIWVLLGFGHPGHAADFNYWSKVGLLSVQEATVLSVGLEPNVEHIDFLERVRDAAGQPNMNDQAIFLSKRYRLMRDHFPMGVEGFVSVSPNWLMSLVKKIDLEVPDGLKASLAYLDKANSEVDYVEKPAALASSEKGSMLRLIAAMACEQYNYDPKASRSHAVSSLRADLDLVGLPLDDKTIRKWLREACELVPNEYWDID